MISEQARFQEMSTLTNGSGYDKSKQASRTNCRDRE